MNNFYRCLDCLTVFTTETKETNPLCGICQGKTEYLGEVNGGKLYKYHYETPCDGRCTHATGPECECSCGGANHGSGKLVKVATVNNIPVLQAENPKALEIATEYRKLVESVRNAIHAQPFYEDFRRGNYIKDKAAWWKIESSRRKLSKAASYKTHSRRMKELNKILGEVQP